MSTERWNRLISCPLVIADKKDAPLVIWGKPTETVELDDNGYMRCTGGNIEKLFALQIDVDGGFSIPLFERDYHRYSYQLYTSYSHTFKEGGDRYRVVFPLKEPLYVRHLVKPVKNVLHDMFPMIDITCFDRGHWQIFPCIRERGVPYEYRQHDGELLSFKSENFAKIAEEYSEASTAKRAFAEADRDPSSNHQGALDYVQRVFDETGEGSRNTTVFSKLMWLRDTVGCNCTEVMSLTPPDGFDDEYAKMVQRLF